MNYKISHELLEGTWIGGADDGSGLRTMVYNYGITFNQDGTGISFSWNKEEDGYQEFTYEIEWKLYENNLIGIKYIGTNNDQRDWENFEIEISDFIGAYGSQHIRIVNKGKDTFWDFPEPLYRSKQRIKKNGLLKRIWNKLKS